MNEAQQAAASATIASVLDQVVTMRAEHVSFEAKGAGSLARIQVAGGGHEILCELNADGDLLSASVVEL